jgi:hypothetical protein
LLLNKSLSLTPAQLYQREKEGALKDIGNFSNFNIKDKVSKIVEAQQEEIQQKFAKLYEEYKANMDKLAALKALSISGASAQNEVEKKERSLRGKVNKVTDSLENVAKAFGDTQTKQIP